MIRFERTTDLDLVRLVFTHPRIYPFIGDDFTAPRGEFLPSSDPRVLYLGCWDEGNFLGILTFVPLSRVLYEMHCTLLPCAWGPRAKAAGVGAIAWLFAAVPECARIVCAVPATNRLAVAIARRVGMTQYGVNPRAFVKGGRLVDLVLLGISRD